MLAGLLTMVVVSTEPTWGMTNKPGALALAGVALVGGAIQFAAAGRISVVAGYPLLTVGTIGVALAQVVVDPATTAGQALGLLYLWIALSAALYCTTAATAVQLVIIGAAHGVALAVAHTAVWLPQWVMTFGTAVVLAGLVNILARELNARAHTDQLTGAFTRRALLLRLTQEIRIAERRGIPLSAVLLDLDRFKELNASRGHAAGDKALRTCVEAWRAAMRPTDLLARLGGDEFLVVMPGCTAEQAQQVTERLLTAVPAVSSELACSAGVTEWRPGDSTDVLLHRADQAMYAAKALGGNTLTAS